MSNPVPLILPPDDGLGPEPAVFPIEGTKRADQLEIDDFIRDGMRSARVVRVGETNAGIIAVLLSRRGIEWLVDLPVEAEFTIVRLVDENLDR